MGGLANITTERLRRKVGTYALTANGQNTFDIPRVQNIDAIEIEVNAILNVTGVATSVRAESPSQLLKTIQFSADGKDTLCDVPFSHLVFGNFKRYFAKNVTPPTGVAVASYTVRAVGVLDQANTNGLRPKDTSFQAWLAQLLQLTVTTGAAADCFAGGTVSLTSGTVNVYVHSHQELVKADGSTDQGEPKRISKKSKISFTYSAADSARQIILPIGNAFRAIRVHVLDNTTAGIGEPSNTLINNMKLSLNDTDVRFSLPGNVVRDHNMADAGIPAANMPAGFYVLDASPDGKFNEYINARGTPTDPITRAVLELDLAAPAGTALVEISVEEDIF